MVELDPRLISRFRSLSRTASLAVAAIGGLALVGWIAGVDVLKSVVPGMVTMKANSAVCFIATGLALRALVDCASGTHVRALARTACFAVALFAGLVLSQYVFGWNAGVDQLLFGEAAREAGTSHPGRMAPNTALSFVLVAAALLLFDRHAGRYRISSIMAALVGLMSFAALLGYTSGVTGLHGVSHLTQMSIPSAASFVLLALAIPFARPDRGAVRLLTSRTVAGHTARRLVPTVITIPAVLGLIRLEGQQLGLYGTSAGTWLFVLAIVSLALPLAYLLARSLEREETARRRATAQLEARERRYRAKYRAARVLTESPALEPALEGILAVVGQELDWSLGAVWLEDEVEGTLEPRAVWGSWPGAAQEFCQACGDVGISPGVGLPGSVWVSREPAWVSDTAADDRFVRKQLAARLGLRSTLCVPIASGETGYGVMELFRREQAPPDEPMLEAMTTLGLELGQFLKRIRAESELRLQGTIMSNMAEGVCLVRVGDWSIVYANETFERMFGYERGELEGQPVSKVNAPSERDPVELAGEIQASLARDGVWSGEVHNVKKDGTPFWCRANVANYDHPLHGTLSVAVHTDITARKRAQEQLRESRERLAAILENSPTVIFLKDIKGRYLLINHQFVKRWGVTQEIVEGKTDHELWPPEVADVVRANDLEVIDTGAAIEVEEVILDRTYLSIKFPLRDPDGEIYAVGGVATDITDRKRADDELRRERRQLAEAEALAKLGSWEWDLATGQVEWSDQQYRIYGLEPGEPLPPPSEFVKLVHADDRERVAAELAASAQDAKDFESEFRLNEANGTTPIVNVRAAVVPGPDGKPAELAGSTQDVTQQRAFEQELTLARDEALAATRLKSQFLANMSHEIRTPMHGLVGMTELMLETELTPEQREYAERARSAGETLVALVNDVLDVSKIEAGKLHLDKVEFRLGEALADVTALMSTRARQKGLELATLIESDVPPLVWGDDLRLRQILGNLVSNAVKFTSEGEVTVRVSRGATIGDRVRVRFEVKDTGIGIEPQQLSRLFESFEQADASLTREYGGTGLGLTIARQLTEMMDGEIGATSTPSRGSTFRVTIPFAVGNAEASVVQRTSSLPFDKEGGGGAEQAARPKLPPESERPLVLVAEDNEINQLLALRMLERRGYRVDLAVNGREAVEAVARADYALVLMDCQMPELDGYGAARAIRSRENERGEAPTPIVAMTANSMRGDRELCLAAGMDGYLAKPLEAHAFEAALARWAPAPAAGAPAEPAHALEHDALAQLTEELGAPDLVAQLLEIFADQTPNQIAAMRLAAHADDPAEVGRLAHTLKGGARTLGASHLASLCRELEEQSRAGSLEQADALIEAIEEAFGQARKALAAELAEAR